MIKVLAQSGKVDEARSFEKSGYQVCSGAGVWWHFRQGKSVKGDDAARCSVHRFYRNHTKQTSQNVTMSKQLKATAAVVGGVTLYLFIFFLLRMISRLEAGEEMSRWRRSSTPETGRSDNNNKILKVTTRAVTNIVLRSTQCFSEKTSIHAGRTMFAPSCGCSNHKIIKVNIDNIKLIKL